jgi:hypothetical protein
VLVVGSYQLRESPWRGTVGSDRHVGTEVLPILLDRDLYVLLGFPGIVTIVEVGPMGKVLHLSTFDLSVSSKMADPVFVDVLAELQAMDRDGSSTEACGRPMKLLEVFDVHDRVDLVLGR